MSRFNKIAIITGVILLIIIVAVLVFRKVGRNQPYKILDPVVLLDNGVAYPTLSQDEKSILFYNTSKNLLQQIDLQSKVTSDISENVLGVYDIAWSPAEDQAIVSTSKQENGDYTKTIYFFSLADKKLTALVASKMENIAWSPSGDQIAYTFPIDTNNVNVSIAKPDGSGEKNVAQIKTSGAPLAITWTNNQLKVFKPYYNPPESYDMSDQDKAGALYTINISNNKVSQADLTDIADIKYSPDGNYYAFEKDVGVSGSFNIADSTGGIHTVQAPLDSFSSVVWSKNSQNIYDIANNNNSATKNVLALYQVKASDYSATKLVDFALPDLNEKTYFIDNLLVTEQENYLFFTRQNTLYSYRIK
jgi:hypothetical protein